jgi:iron complex transport system ATP-binding protein
LTIEIINADVVRDRKHLLSSVDMVLEPGQVVSIIGPNGAGKSTMLRLMSGELEPNAGTATLDGVPISGYDPEELAGRRAALPQRSLLDFPFMVADVIEMGRIPHLTGHANDRQIVGEVVDALDLALLEDRIYTTLSGGERQRVQLARVLSQLWDRLEGSYLLFDEPTAPLDLAHQLGFLQLVRDLARQGAACLLVMHDLNLAARFSDAIVLLTGGRVLASGTPIVVMTKDNIGDAFGVEAEVGMIGESPFIHSQRIRR